MKPNEFYEENADNRTYFYSVDLLGRLFLEETMPKNIATSLKSDKFLDFFWRQMRRNDTKRFYDEYPYYSPCGKEHNYVRPADVGVVFHDFQPSDPKLLIFGGSLKQKFSPSDLAFSERTGRFYHRLFEGKAKLQRSGREYGLLRSSVAGIIAADIEFKECDGDDDGGGGNRNGEIMMFKKNKIKKLPSDQESERWGLPPL